MCNSNGGSPALTDTAPRLVGITIAAIDMSRMVAFYNAVFDARLQPSFSIGDSQFYRGCIDGMDLALCPNAIAGVDASQNRQQFRFQVDDIEAVMLAGLSAGGSEINPIDEYEGAKVSSMADPDGNTIEFMQPVH